MATPTEALEILTAVRRSLAYRLSDAIVRNRRMLLEGAGVEGNPFSQNRALDEMIVGLGRLDSAIAALQISGRRPAAVPAREAASAPGHEDPSLRDGVFAQFTEFMTRGRLEEGARELARILRMPHDRMTTATRFFDRAARADPSIARQLAELPTRLENASSAQCMTLLVKLFGFQAVETRMAVQALQGNTSAAPSAAAIPTRVVL